ncbi:zf-CCHC domain-containing protein [Tanacetum coccineum]
MEKDSKIYKGKKERVKSISLKAKKESSDDETSTSGSDDEEYAMAVRNFKKFFRRKGKFVRKPREEKKSFRQRDEKKGKSNRKCFRCGDPNHLIGDCPKPPRNKDQKAFIGGSWSDSENDAEDKTNDETCLMAQSSNEMNRRLFTVQESPIPFEPATQVGFDIEEIIFNPNKEVALLYPPHTNSDYFKVVLDFISKCCLREAFTRTPNQYKEYLSEFWYTAKALKNSKMEGYGNDGVTLNPTQVFSVHNWARKKNQAEGPSFTTHMLASCNADEHVAFKAFKTSSKTEKKDTKCTKPRAKSR